MVLEATYGWCWAVDTLQEAGAAAHLAHPLGVKMFTPRRVKNDALDARDLADLLRMGRLAESWVAPPAVRELRELVRHRHSLVALRTGLRCQAARRFGADLALAPEQLREADEADEADVAFASAVRREGLKVIVEPSTHSGVFPADPSARPPLAPPRAGGNLIRAGRNRSGAEAAIACGGVL